MDSDQTITVDLGFLASKIIEISVIIFRDDGYSFSFTGHGSFSGTFYFLPSNSYITLYRVTGGTFDSSSYDDSIIDRGQILIKYTL